MPRRSFHRVDAERRPGQSHVRAPKRPRPSWIDLTETNEEAS